MSENLEREIIIGGKTISLDFQESKDGIKVEVNGNPHKVIYIPLPDGRRISLVNGAVVEWSDSGLEDEKNVRYDGILRQVKVKDPRSIRRGSSATGHSGGRAEIKAPMPGKVVKVLVESGQIVEQDQGIVVLEAMKMENELRTPAAGKVSLLDAEVGATVDAGSIVAVIEPSTE